MSNCIRISENSKSITFHPDQIDADGLLALIDKHSQCNEASYSDGGSHPSESKQWTEESGDCSMIYWFLNRQNVRLNPSGSVTISFGKARSSHTWRDFQGTISVINKFVKRPVFCWFTMQDASDGFRSWFFQKITFRPGHDGSILTKEQRDKIAHCVANNLPVSL